MNYLIQVEERYMEIYSKQDAIYRGTVDRGYLDFTIYKNEDMIDNTVILFDCSNIYKEEFLKMLHSIGFTTDDFNTLIKTDHERQLMMWQQDLNKQGYLTKIENNQLLIVDKLN